MNSRRGAKRRGELTKAMIYGLTLEELVKADSPLGVHLGPGTQVVGAFVGQLPAISLGGYCEKGRVIYDQKKNSNSRAHDQVYAGMWTLV